MEQEVPSGGPFRCGHRSSLTSLTVPKEAKPEQCAPLTAAVVCESGESYLFGNRNLSFRVFAAQEIGITGNNKLELTAFILDDLQL